MRPNDRYYGQIECIYLISYQVLRVAMKPSSVLVLTTSCMHATMIHVHIQFRATVTPRVHNIMTVYMAMAANSAQLIRSTMSGLIARGQKMKGDRCVCEDFITVEVIREKSREKIDFLALFDGHAGAEAAEYARDHLSQAMKKNKDIYSSDPLKVSRALDAAFIKVHEDMWSVRGMIVSLYSAVCTVEPVNHKIKPLK